MNLHTEIQFAQYAMLNLEAGGTTKNGFFNCKFLALLAKSHPQNTGS